MDAVAVIVSPEAHTIGASRICSVVPGGMEALEIMLNDVPLFTKNTLMLGDAIESILEILMLFTMAVPETPE
jgi:hypothetical protein